MSDTERKVEVLYYEPKCKKQKKKNGKIRVAAYCRVSTLFEEQELSFKTQCEYYEKLIESQPNKELVGIYGDQGISGLLLKERVEFMRMMEDCRAGKIDEVITKSVSRFSRNMSNTVKIINELKSLGIAVIFEKEGINASDPNSELFLNILASLAQEESNSISQANLWTKAKRAEAGRPVRVVSYGYRRKKDGKSVDRDWEIYEPEAAIIRTAFELAAKGMSYGSIVERLNKMEQERGVFTETWDKGRVKRVFRNEVYKGDILTNKRVCLDYLTKRVVVNRGEREQFYIAEHHPPIVSQERWELVNHLVDAWALRTDLRQDTRKKVFGKLGIEV